MAGCGDRIQFSFKKGLRFAARLPNTHTFSVPILLNLEKPLTHSVH